MTFSVAKRRSGFSFRVFFANLCINLRRSRDVFVPSFVRSFYYPRFSLLWPAFTLTVHINALYNESVHEREEHATCINTIPLKIATLLNLQTLKWAYTFGTDVLIVSTTSHPYLVLRRLARVTLDVSGHDHFGTECRSKHQFGSLIRYSFT